jgi:hypothetical protein
VKKKLAELVQPANKDAWVRYLKLPGKEKGVDGKPATFIDKGEYMDGSRKEFPFIREEPDLEVPFRLAHRGLKKTDKNLFIEDMARERYQF